MKPVLHGINSLEQVVTVRVPSEKVNVEGLINTFEANRDKAVPLDWMQTYKKIVPLYKELFTYGELKEATLMNTDFTLLELAQENIAEELSELYKKPSQSNGRDYYYEFGRSIGVEQQAATLKEYLDDECDFI